MIQRIQSLLLLLTVISLVLGALMPIGSITTAEAHYLFTPWVLKLNIPEGNIVMTTYYIGIVQIVLAIIAFIAIFMYKNRTAQSKLCIVGIFINFILLLLMLFIYPDRIFPTMEIFMYEDIKVIYNPWCITSILSVAFLYFANKQILNDEKKVRDADRLR